MGTWRGNAIANRETARRPLQGKKTRLKLRRENSGSREQQFRATVEQREIQVSGAE
jgi:hypothetical protein